MEAELAPRAWVLNLDAEYELANLTMTQTGQRVVASLPRGAFPFVAPNDYVIDRDGDIPCGLEGHAWCPTSQARQRLLAHGAVLTPVPSETVLKVVNHRAFVEPLGWALPDTVFATDELEAERALRRAGAWFAKRPLSMAGRGKRMVDAARWSDADARWVAASIRRFGGLLIEPRVAIEAEFCLHAWLASDGSLHCAAVKRLCLEPSGRWLGSQPAGPELLSAHAAVMQEQAALVAHALHGAGYFGPFGIDGYRATFRGKEIFVPRSEVNARYSLGWSLRVYGAGAP